MPDWSMMKILTKKQSNRSSRIAGGWTQGWQPAPESNILRNVKKQKPDCPKGEDLRNELRIWELARGMYCDAKKLAKDIEGAPQEIGTEGRSFWGRPWLKVGCCANDCCCYFHRDTTLNESIIQDLQTNWITVIPRLTKIIRSGITFVSRNLR
jgi:hypothetical protein